MMLLRARAVTARALTAAGASPFAKDPAGWRALPEAAHLGSNLGAFRLGEAFFKGNGLPKDPVQARFWLKTVVCGEWKFDHLSDNAKAKAKEWLRDLQLDADVAAERARRQRAARGGSAH